MNISIFGYSIPAIIFFWLVVRLVQNFQRSSQEKKIAQMTPQERQTYADKLKADLQGELTRPRTFFEKFISVIGLTIIGAFIVILLILVVYFFFFNK